MSALSRYANRNNTYVGKYFIVTDTSSLEYQLYLSHQDLNYSLKKEVSRDRFVANSPGLEKAIEEVVNNSMMECERELVNLVSTDIINEVQAGIASLNGTYGNMTIHTSQTSSAASKFGRMLGNKITKGVTDLVNDITKVD